MSWFGPKQPSKQLPAGQQQVQAAPGQDAMTRGTIENTPCPVCGTRVNFKDVEDYGLEAGAVYTCDNQGCRDPQTGQRGMFTLVRVQPVTMVWLRRFIGTPHLPR
jgi:hypothetical protein